MGPRPLFVIATVASLLVACGPRSAELGFWLEPVSFSSPRIGGAIAASDLRAIEAIARSEIVTAFEQYNAVVLARRDAHYRVRVVQELSDQRMKRSMRVAGESRAAAGFGGSGAVSFSFMASGAMVYAPDDASRPALIEAIGRGIGRVAVHEFTHQLLPDTPIHDSRDIQSYEGASAASPEPYFGTMRWDLAQPLLRAKLGYREKPQ